MSTAKIRETHDDSRETYESAPMDYPTGRMTERTTSMGLGVSAPSVSMDPSASQTPKSVSMAARYCAQQFVRESSIKDYPKDLKVDFETQLSRFKIWVGDLGVSAVGSASADYRLRNDPDIKDVLISLLTRLSKKVEDFHDTSRALCGIDEGPHAETTKKESASSASSSSSLVLDSEANSEAEEDVRGREPQTRRPLLKDIENIISRLYRFSALIRKPVSSNEKQRVGRYIEREQANLDLTEFESHVHWQLQRQCPRLTATSVLAKRLAAATLYRRKKILYRASHQQKLEHGMEEWFWQQNPQFVEGDISPMAVPLIAQSEDQYGTRKAQKSPEIAVTFVETEASAIKRAPISTYAKSAVLSGVTMSAAARRQHLDIPPVPRPLKSEIQEVKCPYCSQIITGELGAIGKMQEDRWRRHVLRDIDPYVCLFEDCNTSSEQFKTTEEWIHHMRWQHTTLYSCQFVGHEKDFFATLDLFEQHLKQDHAGSIADAELSAMIQQGIKPAPDVFATLAMHINQDVQNISEKISLCPLCYFSLGDVDASPDAELKALGIASFPDSLHKEIRDHVAAHLESIALLSLPDRDDLDEEVSNKLLLETTEYNDDQDDSDLPALVFEYPDRASPVPHGFDPTKLHPPPLEPIEEQTGTASYDWDYVLKSLEDHKQNKYTLDNDPILQKLAISQRSVSPFNDDEQKVNSKYEETPGDWPLISMEEFIRNEERHAFSWDPPDDDAGQGDLTNSVLSNPKHKRFFDRGFVYIPLMERQKLGQSSRANVYKVVPPNHLYESSKYRRPLALKVLNCMAGEHILSLKEAREEVETMKDVVHPHIMAYIASYEMELYRVEGIESYVFKRILGIVMYPPGQGNLAQYIQPISKELFNIEYGESTKLNRWMLGRTLHLYRFFGCIAQAISYLHGEALLIHRDIKPENIIIDEFESPILTDFAFAESLTPRTSRKTGYIAKRAKYISPEIMYENQRGFRSDVFSLGCVYLEMITIILGKSLESLHDYRCRDKPNEELYYSETIKENNAWIENLNSATNPYIGEFRPELPSDVNQASFDKKVRTEPLKVLRIIKSMTQENPAERPHAYELWGNFRGLYLEDECLSCREQHERRIQGD